LYHHFICVDTGGWCKSKWQALRGYYGKLQKKKKGKSGDAAKKNKAWLYYTTIDRILSSCASENTSTQSNLDDESQIEPSGDGEDLNAGDTPCSSRKVPLLPKMKAK
jgi:hypothetical protein